jgi:hypothetical protein
MQYLMAAVRRENFILLRLIDHVEGTAQLSARRLARLTTDAAHRCLELEALSDTVTAAARVAAAAERKARRKVKAAR